THFTSPIRRYPDLLVHRVIKALLGGGRYGLLLPSTVVSSTSTFKGKGGKAPAKGLPAAPTKVRTKAKVSTEEAQAWEVAGIHCSVNERRADEASRDVEAWLKCMFMRERLGEEYGGTVSTVASFGLFVQLDGLYVEGLIHITELGGDYFKFDEARQELRGERTGVRYSVGNRVRVQVSRVDLDSRKIDFRIVREGQGPLGEATGGRRRGRGGAGEGGESAQAQLADVQRRDRDTKREGKAAKAGKGSARKGAVSAQRDELRSDGLPASPRPAGKKAPSRKSVRRRS
ncbi:MAG TPA: S1 RNA-binding domain-containing protein, partial [Aquabacterium sp.]|nr:S1 RNA-binding domain-containing protein [Aquabacterium sp.]